MAHEIHNDGKKDCFAFVGEAGWHGLGQQLTPNSPLSVWEQEAGLDWEIRQGDCTTLAPDGTLIKMPERQLLYRSDTLAPLAVVSSKYRVVQPREVLHFYEDLLESAGFTMETAGVLFGGKRFWAMARCNQEEDVVPGDRVAQYLLLTTACDGSLATTAKFTSVRVVCNNTASMALRHGGTATVRVPHNRQFDAPAVKRELGVSVSAWDTFLLDARALAARDMSRQEAAHFLVQLLGEPALPLEDQPVAAANTMQAVYSLWDRSSMGNELAGHTAWGMWSAITEYYDWHTGHKTADARMANAWFGEGDKVKTAAFDLLLATTA